ncbi:MAG: lysophospholipid acyltransferase family protein [Peptococcales bacterium]|jgi:1-acyl-sn-glycerol-3-phosphate acyltransferase
MLYNFLKCLLGFFMLFLVKIDVKNLDRLPKNGPVIIACNHLSNWDPIILGVYLPRKLHFMAKEELFKIFILGSIIKQLGTFPVKRGVADRNAIREGLKILQENKVLVLFPEGTRSKTGELLPFQSGVALFAHKGNAPLVPIGLTGSNTILSKGLRAQVTLNIGEPIYLDQLFEGKVSGVQLEEVTQILQNKVKDLLC